MSFDHPTVKPALRTLTVCPSCRGLPRIVLSGEWVREWGFEIGDALLAYYTGPGALLLKIDNTENGRSFPASNLPATPYPVSKMDAIKLRLHPTQVRTPDGRLPKITIIGAWLHEWKISVGNRVSVTRTEDGDIRIQVQTVVPQVREIKEKSRLQDEVAHANALLDSHKAAHPELYPDLPENLKIAYLRKNLIDSLKNTKPDVLPILFKCAVLTSAQIFIHASEEAYQAFLKTWAADSLDSKTEYKIALRTKSGQLTTIVPMTGDAKDVIQDDLMFILGISVLGIADNIILARNQPDGLPQPCEDDIALARMLKERAGPLGVPLWDFLIITSAGYYSFAEKGQL